MKINVEHYYNILSLVDIGNQPSEFKVRIANTIGWELYSLLDYASRAENPSIQFGIESHDVENKKLQIFFSVSDLNKPNNPNQVNWHLQNTSQWLYAGAIIIEYGDKKYISSHH